MVSKYYTTTVHVFESNWPSHAYKNWEDIKALIMLIDMFKVPYKVGLKEVMVQMYMMYEYDLLSKYYKTTFVLFMFKLSTRLTWYMIVYQFVVQNEHHHRYHGTVNRKNMVMF